MKIADGAIVKVSYKMMGLCKALYTEISSASDFFSALLISCISAVNGRGPLTRCVQSRHTPRTYHKEILHDAKKNLTVICYEKSAKW
jgi:hypothetical protein